MILNRLYKVWMINYQNKRKKMYLNYKNKNYKNNSNKINKY